MSIRGSVQAPPDKSISHRAALLAAIAQGPSLLKNFLQSADCLATLSAIEALGVRVIKKGEDFVVEGKGPGAWKSPAKPLDLGNSGTGTRLLTGLLAGREGLHATITGDASLRQRPMKRILEPLSRMGARIEAREGNLAPLDVHGASLKGLRYAMPVASAQVKSALLLAGLQAQGTVEIVEPAPTRDHTERMIAYLGGRIEKKGNTVVLKGPQSLQGKEMFVPGDISSAAFLMAAALLIPGSSLTIQRVCLNPTRTGILQVLQSMGAKLRILPDKQPGMEPMGDIEIAYAPLKAVRLDDAALMPNIIDEIPVLAVLAACAKGVTEIRHAGELRVKETDRIRAIAENLRAIGAGVEEFEDGLRIKGPVRFKAAAINSYKDHRIAMAFSLAGLCADGPMQVSDTEFIDTSFPGFFETLDKIQQ